MALETDGQAQVPTEPTQPTTAQTTPDSTQTQVAAPTAKPTGYTYSEDRSRWIPPHRLAEETTKRERLQAEYEQAQKRIQALAGVNPVDPGQAKADQVKEAIAQLFPQLKHLSNLTDEQMQRLLQAPDMASKAEEIEQREYRRHGQAQLERVYDAVADTLGAEKLSETQKNDLRESFRSWYAGQCQAELEASGGAASPTLNRFEQGDPTLIQEFVKRYTNDWIEPARRRATAQTIQRTRPVPNSMGRSQVTSIQKPAEFKTLDDRLEYAAQLYSERGGRFKDR